MNVEQKYQKWLNSSLPNDLHAQLESMNEKAVKQIQRLYEENLKRINNNCEKLVQKCK